MTKQSWVLGRREATWLAVSYLIFTATLSALGWLLTRRTDGWWPRLDHDIAQWFVEQRTPTLDSLSFIGSMLADTVVKIVVTAIIASIMLIRWRRWLEPTMVVVPLILEAMAFLTITLIVNRPRPDVPRLDTSPVGSSFPSGHVAAAAAYSAIVVVVFWRTDDRRLRWTAVAVATLLAVVVGISRMYRGMHYFTDVVMGALLGGACVAVSAILLRHATENRRTTE